MRVPPALFRPASMPSPLGCGDLGAFVDCLARAGLRSWQMLSRPGRLRQLGVQLVAAFAGDSLLIAAEDPQHEEYARGVPARRDGMAM